MKVPKARKLSSGNWFIQLRLGGESIVFDDYADGELERTKDIELKLARIMREKQVNSVLYHWPKSMHKDHEACHRIVVDAWFYAAIAGFERELPKHFARHLYFAENWEDAPEFTPYVYLDVSDGYPLWEKAIDHHWFAVHSTSFPYKEYYSHLKRLRGIQGRKGYCECFMIPAEQVKLVHTLEEL